jgi:hypothetical protein
MGDAVVHLTGDPGTLFRRGQGAALVPFALKPLGPVTQGGEVSPAGARVETGHQDGGCESGGVRDATDQLLVPSWATTSSVMPAISAAAATACPRRIVAATVYRLIASATGKSAPRSGHCATRAATSSVQTNTGPGHTRRSGSAAAVTIATIALVASDR